MFFKDKTPKKEKHKAIKPVDVGDMFTYLGVEMIRLQTYCDEEVYGCQVIIGRYVNTSREFKQIILIESDWNAIKKINL